MFNTIAAKISARLQDETGATAVEYGLLVTLIALVMAVGATALGLEIQGLFNGINL